MGQNCALGLPLFFFLIVSINNSKVVGVLFEDKQRESPEKKSHIDSYWDYFDSSGRVEAQRVRRFLPDGVSEYPDAERSDLIARIKSGDDGNFPSATLSQTGL